MLESAMGQTISSPADMLAYAGDLRRAAKQAATPEISEKVQRTAAELEKTALTKVAGSAGAGIGALLDTFA
jgi:hypothetical protein